MNEDHERQALHAGIQAALDEHEDGAILTGWILTCEVSTSSGERWLLHRSGDLDGNGLKSWNALGYLHSTLQSVEIQSANTFRDPEDDE